MILIKISAHQQQKLYLLEKKLTDIEKKNEMKREETETLHNLTELGKYESL